MVPFWLEGPHISYNIYFGIFCCNYEKAAFFSSFKNLAAESVKILFKYN